MESGTRRGTLPLAWSLFLAFGALVVLTCAGVVLLFSELNDRRERDVSSKLFRSMQDQTRGELQRLFHPLVTAAHEARGWARRGLVRRHDEEALKALFLPQMQELPQSCSMMISDLEGYEFLLMRNLGPGGLLETERRAGRWITRDFRREEWGRESRWALWNEEGDRLVRRWKRELDYDPRPRPWHAGPRALPREEGVSPLHWTGVDVFFTSKTAGITASLAVEDPEGELLVIGYDLLLSDLSEFTQTLSPSEGAQVFVCTDEGALVGLPRDERFTHADMALAALLKPAEEVGSPPLAAGVAAWRAGGRETLEPTQLEVEGETWWVSFRPFRISAEHTLWIGAVLPERDLLLSRAETAGVLLIGFIGLSLATLLTFLISRSFARPLTALARTSRRVAELDLSEVPAQPTAVREFAELTEALELMRAALARDVEAREEAKRVLESGHRRAVRATEAKSRFLANLSHDLRTPLQAIVGFTSLLGRSELDGDQQECVGWISQASDALLALIDDILDLSRIEAGELVLDPKPCEPRELVGVALNLVRARAEKKKLELSQVVGEEVPERVLVDPARLRRVLLNLLENAVKFTSSGGITVRVGLEGEVGAQHLWCEVEDTGRGIEPARQAEVFAPFAREGSPEQEGIGLGLSISRRLCEAMGGGIEVESEFGEGSTFLFHVAVEPAPPLAAPLEEPGPAPVANLAVLVAEDNRVNRRLALRLLEGLGCQVTAVTNGREALEALATSDFDLVLLDLQMPELDGLETARQIRAERSETPRIVAMTASATAATRSACYEAGMDRFLAKPVDPADLEELVTDCARAARTLAD